MRLLDGIPCEGRLPATWFEELLHLCLADRALPAVVPQCAIRDRHGRIVARTDLGIPSVQLGLEAHSRRFHFGPDAERLDEDRDLAVAACGWELIYLGGTRHGAPPKYRGGEGGGVPGAHLAVHRGEV